MNVLPKLDMREITRLTRAGKLKEAMSLLKGEALASEPGRTAQGFLNQAAGMLTKAQPRPDPEIIAPGGRFEEHSFTGDAGTRGYKLYIPSRADGRKLPLLVMLHGCTQDPDDFAAGTRMNQLAEAQGFLVAYPRQPQSANLQKCWNWFTTENQARDSGEAAIIAGITRQIIVKNNADASRVYAAGLSAGGAMAAILASAYPDLFAAVGIHSGLPSGAATHMGAAFAAMGGKGKLRAHKRTRLVPTIIFHGDADTVVNTANGGRVAEQAAAGNVLKQRESEGEANGIAYTRVTRSDAAGQDLIDYWILHKADHAWSGGSKAGSYTNPKGPDASREMVRFFQQHHKVV